MTPERDRLAWLALQVAEAAAEACGDRALPRPIELRLALTYLFTISDGPLSHHPTRRSVFDTFWQHVTSEPNPQATREAEYRRMYARTYLAQMARQVRMPDGRSEDGRGEALQRFAEAVRRAGRERDDAGRQKRANYWGPKRG